eukprot:6497384-Lingulodinium_polyedra.AAC.1
MPPTNALRVRAVIGAPITIPLSVVPPPGKLLLLTFLAEQLKAGFEVLRVARAHGPPVPGKKRMMKAGDQL